MPRLVQMLVATLALASTPTLAGNIQGTTYAVRGSVPVPAQAEVTLTGPVNRTMNSNLSGFYKFTDVPPGSYNVHAVEINPPPGSSPLSGDCETVLAVGQPVATCDVYMDTP